MRDNFLGKHDARHFAGVFHQVRKVIFQKNMTQYMNEYD